MFKFEMKTKPESFATISKFMEEQSAVSLKF